MACKRRHRASRSICAGNVKWKYAHLLHDRLRQCLTHGDLTVTKKSVGFLLYLSCRDRLSSSGVLVPAPEPIAFSYE